MTAAHHGCFTRAVLKVGLVAFSSGFHAWLRSRNLKAIARYRAFGRNLFNDIVMRTPEYTGGTAASWKFGVDGVSTEGANYLPVPNMPYVRASSGYGNAAALAIAFAEGMQGAQKITNLAQRIFISNPAQFGGGGGVRPPQPLQASSNTIASAIEHGGNSWLRQENQPDGVVREAVSYAKSYNWYKGGGLSHEF